MSSINPEIMGLGPIGRVARHCSAGMTMDQIDRVEINEAFAAQVLPSAEQLGIDHAKLNVNGGADRARPPVRHDGRPHHVEVLDGLEDAGRSTASRRCAWAAVRASP